MSRLVFEPVAHKYQLDGRDIPSVSAILKAQGDAFYARTPAAMASIDRGSRAHQASELMDTMGMKPGDFDADLVGLLTGWQNFLAETGAKVIQIEQQVFSETLWYAGTFDRIIMLFGHLYLIDLKTGGKQKTHPVQLAAYAVAYEEMTGQHIDAAGIVYLNETKRHFRFDSWRDNSTTQEPFEPHKNTWRQYCAEYRRKAA
jgi:hypothetical protein